MGLWETGAEIQQGKRYDRVSCCSKVRLIHVHLGCEPNACLLVGIYVNVCFRVCAHVTQLQLERDQLYQTFTQSIQEVQHKTGLKSTLLERKLKGLTDDLEKTQALLSSVISASNMDQTALDEVTDKIEVNFLGNSMYFMHVALLFVQEHKRNMFLPVGKSWLQSYFHQELTL